MIEFHAGNGPDSQAVGIALEEMFLTYRVMPGRAPMPVISLAGARVVGGRNIVMALARKTGRFLPASDEAMRWSDTKAFDADALEATLSNAAYIDGEVSVADMAAYPLLARRPELAEGRAAIARWMGAMMRRPATGRGMGVIAG